MIERATRKPLPLRAPRGRLDFESLPIDSPVAPDRWASQRPIEQETIRVRASGPKSVQDAGRKQPVASVACSIKGRSLDGVVLLAERREGSSVVIVTVPPTVAPPIAGAINRVVAGVASKPRERRFRG